MRSVNKVILVGNIGGDLNFYSTKPGTIVASASLATTETYKNINKIGTDGKPEIVSKTEWHRLIFFSKLAEVAGSILKKGSKVYIEGSLKTRTWIDKENKTRQSTEIIVLNIIALDHRKTEDSSKSENFIYSKQENYKNPQDTLKTQVSSDTYQAREQDFTFEEEDIPF